MDFAKFNKERLFDVNTEGFEFCKLATLYTANHNEIYPLDGFFISQSQLGEHPVAIDAAGKRLIDLPSHLCDVFHQISNDVEAVEAIKNGTAGFMIYQYAPKNFNRVCYSIKFVNR